MVSSLSSFIALLAASVATTSTLAFEISYPKSGDYWVSCQNNTLNWAANSTDPSIFSVALLSVSDGTSTLLNGNYQVANSLNTSTGTATISPNCLTAADSGYYLAFVNSSQYSLNEPQVYYTSPVFSLKANGTEAQKVDANTSADPSSQQTSDGVVSDSSASSSSSSASDSTGTSSSAAAATSSGTSDGASSLISAAAGAHLYGATALLLAALSFA